MRILLCINSTQKCGVANFGRLHHEALLKAGADVTLWHADYPTYLPDNVEEFDVVHLNLHPLVLNHIQPQHLPKTPLVSALFHEVPNAWWELNQFPPMWGAVDLRLTEEPVPGFEGDPTTIYWQMPIPDERPSQEVKLSPEVRVGQTGIRGDGLDRLIPACEKNGWALSKSGDAGRWLSMQEEIDRLAECWLVSSHMHSAYSGQASSVLTAIASRRPVLINSSRLLHQICFRDQEVAQELYRIEDVEEGIKTILEDIREGREKRPFKLAEAFSWTQQTRGLLEIWEANL